MKPVSLLLRFFPVSSGISCVSSATCVVGAATHIKRFWNGIAPRARALNNPGFFKNALHTPIEFCRAMRCFSSMLSRVGGSGGSNFM